MGQGAPAGSVLCLSDEHRGGQVGPLLDVIDPALRLPSPLPPAFQGPLENCLGKRVVAGDVPVPHQLSSFDGGKERFLWACKCCDFSKDKFVGLAVSPLSLK